jgi:hypothetical protein
MKDKKLINIAVTKLRHLLYNKFKIEIAYSFDGKHILVRNDDFYCYWLYKSKYEMLFGSTKMKSIFEFDDDDDLLITNNSLYRFLHSLKSDNIYELNMKLDLYTA